VDAGEAGAPDGAGLSPRALRAALALVAAEAAIAVAAWLLLRA
jgi:hypothetical protein